MVKLLDAKFVTRNFFFPPSVWQAQEAHRFITRLVEEAQHAVKYVKLVGFNLFKCFIFFCVDRYSNILQNTMIIILSTVCKCSFLLQEARAWLPWMLKGLYYDLSFSHFIWIEYTGYRKFSIRNDTNCMFKVMPSRFWKTWMGFSYWKAIAKHLANRKSGAFAVAGSLNELLGFRSRNSNLKLLLFLLWEAVGRAYQWKSWKYIFKWFYPKSLLARRFEEGSKLQKV